jgi:predicted dehydrogenase
MNKMDSTKIRVGIIGLGFGGESALKSYKRLSNVEVVALAGLEEDRLAFLGKTYEVPHLYRDYKDLLQHEGLDALSIAVPNSLHAPIAVAAFERGLHVLCEKPLARTSEEAETMVQAATKANRVLRVVYNHRERNDIQFLKRYITEGNLGTIYYAKAYWMRRRGIPGTGSWFVNKQIAGGGPLIDLGVHVLDIALFLLDEPAVKSVTASTYNELGSQGIGFDLNAGKSGSNSKFEVEDLATAFIRLASGTTLLLETSWATHSSAQDDYGIVLYGTQGGADIRTQKSPTGYTTTDTLTIYTNVAGVPTKISPHIQGGEFHAAVIRDFIDIITSGNWSLHNGSDGLRRARIIDACYTSALQGREVILES